MQNLLTAVRTSCSEKNWYAALYMALTLPDICANLQEPGAKESGKRYRAWFDRYLKPVYKSEFHGPDFHFLRSGDCWALRCSLLHEGSDEISGQRSREVLSQFKFTTQGVHLGMMEDVLVLNVSMFCNEVCAAVEGWLQDVAADYGVQERIGGMARVEVGGFSPIPGVWLGERGGGA